MSESFTYGSVGGVGGNPDSYPETVGLRPRLMLSLVAAIVLVLSPAGTVLVRVLEEKDDV